MFGLFQFISLDGDSLGTDDLMRLAKGELKIKLTKEAINRVTKARNLLEGIVEENKSIYFSHFITNAVNIIWIDVVDCD